MCLIQVGDFFEMYAHYDGERLVGPDLARVCDICNLQLTRKNKAILEATYKNPMMAGFPLYIISKHVQTLTNAGYTVVIVRQVTPPPNPRREVTDIISPATHIENTQRDGAYLMAVVWETLGESLGKLQAVGMAAVDVSSGEVLVYETASRSDNRNFAEDEVARWLHTYAPKEVIELGACGSKLTYNGTTHADWGTEFPFPKLAFQNELFKRAFPSENGLMSPIESIGLCPYELARTALAALLQFVHEHNEAYVRQLLAPRFLSPNGHLHLDYNSALQLNLLGTGAPGERPLTSLLNKCSTAFGARVFKDRLVNPITDIGALQARYDAIQQYIDAPDRIPAIRKHLQSVQDLERMARRLSVCRFAPMEWPSLVQSLNSAAAALGYHPEPSLIDEICSNLNLDEAAKYAINDVRANIFQLGVVPELDALSTECLKHQEFFTSKALELGAKLEISERDGYQFTTTKKRWLAQAKNFTEITTKPISASSTTIKLLHPEFTAKSDAIVIAANKLRAAVTTAYKAWLEENGVNIANKVRAWVAPIASLDIDVTNAKNALDFAYTRPLPIAGPPSLDIKALRHPMIERFLTDIAYVPNDVALSQAKHSGWLLYGMNAAGKSSLMKATGLAVIMAQAGMFVPATQMTFTPYEHLFTRISGADNIYRGMSTFVVEMTELRNILQRATSTSLVLGDELCAGTEALSANAIITAGVLELLKREASFIFATHLHDLVDIPLLQAPIESGALRVCHLHVEVINSELMYDRALRDGVGHRTYGIEVCRGLGLPDAFLREADAVRRHLQGIERAFMSSKTSSYNAQVFVDTCGVCGEQATEVHHIKYQKDAQDGKHGHIHKNHASNLVPLCEDCHKKQHAGLLNIIGWAHTSKGRVLSTSSNSSPCDL